MPECEFAAFALRAFASETAQIGNSNDGLVALADCFGLTAWRPA
jgi:hypothetical protein